MIGTNIHNLVNPIQGSAYSTRGLKPDENFITFSVGTKFTQSDDYITKSDSGEDVLVDIIGSVATFSFPQTHSYVGVGDEVITNSGTFYLNKKINNKSWSVTSANGGTVPDSSGSVLTSINKTFSTLHGATTGLAGLMGTQDLVTLDSILRIAVYGMTEVRVDPITIDNMWVTSIDRFVRIFAPSDTRYECNSSQRHNGVHGNPYSYRVKAISNSPVLNLNADYCEVEGLDMEVEGVGHFSDGTGTGCKLFQNVLKGDPISGASGVFAKNGAIVRGNILYDCPIKGIDLDNTSVSINNTIVDCTNAIVGVPGSQSWNDLIQGASAGITGLDSGDIHTTVTNDGTGDIPGNKTVIFRDGLNDDFHIDFASNIETDVISGGTPGVPSEFYRDIDQEKISGSGWPIGADYFVPVAYFAVGRDTSDIQSGSGNVIIENGEATFDEDQTNETLCSGCLLTAGGNKYYLYKKISDNSWQVTSGVENALAKPGLAPADLGSTAVESIKYPFNDINTPLYDDGGNVGIYEEIGDTDDLVAAGIKVVISCAQGSLYEGSMINSDFNSDESHFIKIYTPNEPGVDCNTSRRHNGVGIFDQSIPYMNGVGSAVNHAIEIMVSHTEIEGLQLRSNMSCIKVSKGTNIKITKNIMNFSQDDAVLFETEDGGGGNVIANNIVYDCFKNGISIKPHANQTTPNNFYIFNNTVYNTDIGVYIDMGEVTEDPTNNIYLYNNLVQKSRSKDYFSTVGDSPNIISESNFGSDKSINTFGGLNNRAFFTAEFKDVFSDDFHLTFYDSLNMVGVKNLSSNKLFPIDDDIDGGSRNVYKWDAGADNWSPYSGKEVHYSVGSSTIDLENNPGRLISIKDSILTFAGSDISTKIGVGDKVTFSGGPCYLSEKGNDKKWVVRDNQGNLFQGDIVDEVGTGIFRVSNDLSVAIDETGALSFQNELDLSSLAGPGDRELNHALSDIERLYAWCYDDGDVDMGNITVQNWITDSNHKIIIQTPWSTKTQAVKNQRHLGYWGNSGFSIEADNSTCVVINNNYVSLMGLKIKPQTVSDIGVVIDPSKSNITVSNSIIKDSLKGISQVASTSLDVYIFANTVYNTVTFGIEVHSASVYNNTVVGTLGNGIASSTGDRVWNNMVTGFTGCFVQSDSAPIDNDYRHNISSDATAIISSDFLNGNKINANILFKDTSPGNEDYHLSRADILAINHGTPLSQDDLPIVSHAKMDIGSQELVKYNLISKEFLENGSWSIGSDIAPDVDDIDIYFSVGKDSSNLKEVGSVSLIISDGVATFSEPQMNDGIGIGNIVLYDGSTKECFLNKKVDDSNWEVRTRHGLIPEDATSSLVVNEIKHVFNDIAVAVSDGASGIKQYLGDSNNPFDNIHFANYRINLPVYGYSSPFTNRVEVKEYVSDPMHYINIYSPHDTKTEVMKRQRHDGVNFLTDDNPKIYDIQLGDEVVLIRSDYTRFDGIIIQPSINHNYYTDAITVERCLGSRITGNVIFDTQKGIHVNGGKYVYDDFSSAYSPFWNTDFSNNWVRREVSPGKYISIDSGSTGGLQNLSESLTTSFDLEFGIYVNEEEVGVGRSCAVLLTDSFVPGTTYLKYHYDEHNLRIDGAPDEDVGAPVVPGRVYRCRIVRGGTLTPDGVYVPGPSGIAIHSYYFDDWYSSGHDSAVLPAGVDSNNGGTGTMKWIEHPGTALHARTASNDLFVMLEGDPTHGLSYLKLSSDSLVNEAEYLKLPGEFVQTIEANNIIYDANDSGIINGGDDICYNNTVDDVISSPVPSLPDTLGYSYENSPTDTLINNISQGNAGSGGFKDNSNIEHCISEDGSAGSSNNCQSNITLDFKNKAARDYTPAKPDESRGTGKYLKSDPLLPFNNDITLKDRGNTWDVGALEFVAKYKIVYAVGTNLGDISLKNNGTLGYEIVETDGRSLMTFSVAQSSREFGVGNEVVDSGVSFAADGCLIQEKVDELNWYVTDYRGRNVPDGSGLVEKIIRPFNTLAEALDSNFGPLGHEYAATNSLLASEEMQISIACYNDYINGHGLDTSEVDNIYASSDVDYFLRIFAPDNTETEVNDSQRHIGLPGTGYAFKCNAENYPIENLRGLLFKTGSYSEIEGLEISVTGGTNPKAAIESEGNAKNLFISKNIIRRCSGDGVKINSYLVTSGIRPRDVIANNLIHECAGDGISIGDNTQESYGYAMILNNTVIDSGKRGIYVRKISEESGSKKTIRPYVINNIVQDSGYSDYTIDNILNGTSVIRNNISSDPSADYYGGISNHKNTRISFANRPSDNFNLSGFDSIAKDGGLDMSSYQIYSFDTDIEKRVRESEAWDIGAFELLDVDGVGDLIINSVIMSITSSFASTVPPTISLYLRDSESDFLNYVENLYQFTGIEGGDPDLHINQWISDHPEYDFYNLVIYVQGGKSFEGTFSLKNRGNQTVTIKTLPTEHANGPGSIIYEGPLIDDSSSQSVLTLENLKVYSVDMPMSDYLVGNASSAKIIRLINSIVQVNENAISNQAPDVRVQVKNSTIIYRNTLGTATKLFLTKLMSGIENFVYNSTILSYLDGNLEFKTSNVTSNDLVVNSLGFNYGTGSMSFVNSPAKVINPILNQNPKYEEVEYNSMAFTISTMMQNNFLPGKQSPLVDAGDNSYASDISVDIIGNPRIFNFGTVDIGHYEIEVFSRLFSSEEIAGVFQDKLKIDYKNKTYNSTNKNVVYRDLYYQFSSNKKSREEFIRESKIIFRLKPNTNEFRLFTDKKNNKIHTFEAYYDKSSMSIVITKDSDLFNNLFNTIFDDGRYVFLFDEIKQSFTIYENNTFDKGLSGIENVVNKVRFGGSSVLSN